jgi:hypothetical protein
MAKRRRRSTRRVEHNPHAVRRSSPPAEHESHAIAPVPIPHPATPSRAEGIALYTCVALSSALLVADTLAIDFDHPRADLVIELAARAVMLVLVLMTVKRFREDSDLRLLPWAVVLVSLDAYWQTTYRHIGGRPLEWLEMVVKYLATGAGLALLLRVCARFGTKHDALQRYLDLGSVALGVLLVVVGIAHGVLYIGSCYFFVPSTAQCIVTAPAERALQAYLSVDALTRVVIAVAAVIGYIRAPRPYRERTLFVAYFSFWFALGTAVDFVGRMPLPHYAVALLQVADAVTTAFFPLTLVYTASRNKLFVSGTSLIRRTVRYGMPSLIVAAVAAGVEVYLHRGALETTAKKLHVEEQNLEYAVGVPFLLAWKLLEELFKRTPLEDAVERLIKPENAAQRDRLQSFMNAIPYIGELHALERHLETALTHGISATFADIFWRDAMGNTFDPLVSNRTPLPPPLRATDPSVRRVAAGKHVRLNGKDESIPGADIAVPMPVAGKQYGVLICGPPHGEEAHFEETVVKHIKEFATTAGNAIFALKQRGKPRALEMSTPVPSPEVIK